MQTIPFKKILHISVGIILLIVGIFGLVLPILNGIIPIILGLIIISFESNALEKKLIALSKKNQRSEHFYKMLSNKMRKLFGIDGK